MTRLDRHVLIVIGLAALAAVAMILPRNEAGGAPIGASIERLPMALGPWQGRMETMDDVLPNDPRSSESIRRIYEDGPRRLWLGVASYPNAIGPRYRPAIDSMVLERSVTRIERGAASIPLGRGRTLSPVSLTMHYPGRTLTTWYWYQFGRHPIGGEYGLRLRLGVDAVLRQHHPLLLVRVTTTDEQVPTDFFELLMPHLDAYTALAERK